MPFAAPANNRGGVGDPQGPDEWFKSLPIITQCWFGASMVLTLSVNFKIINPYQILWSWTAITSQFELWRVLTPFCYIGPFDFNTLIGAYMMVQFSKQYESGGPFNTGAGGGTADYAFMWLFGALAMLISYPVAGPWLSLPPIFCRNMIYYVLYVWSKRHPADQANIWGFPMPAIYLPFAYMAMSLFMGNPFLDLLHGIGVGHIYYFLVDVVPMVYGKDIVKTPKFLIDYFGVGEYSPARQAARQVPAANNPYQGGGGAGGGAAHRWGTGGQALGR